MSATKRKAASQDADIEMLEDVSQTSKTVNAVTPADIVSGAPRSKKQKPSYEMRSICVPSNRRSPLKKDWVILLEALNNDLKLQARVVTKGNPWMVHLRQSESTADPLHLDRGAEFLRAYLNGFAIEDAKALIRIDGMFTESFQISDVKFSLQGEHVNRAIGRLVGRQGQTKFSIENATRTRIVVADKTIHLLGSYENMQLARRAICDLIMGSQANKVYGRMQLIAHRMKSAL